MKLIALHCPYCGGGIKFDLDTGKKQCFCIHCGQQIILDDEVIRTEHTERTVDEARIHEADIKERIRLKELELAEKERISEERTKKVKIVLSIVLAGIGVALMVAGAVLGSDYSMLMMLGLFPFMGAAYVWILGNPKKK